MIDSSSGMGAGMLRDSMVASDMMVYGRGVGAESEWEVRYLLERERISEKTAGF